MIEGSGRDAFKLRQAEKCVCERRKSRKVLGLGRVVFWWGYIMYPGNEENLGERQEEREEKNRKKLSIGGYRMRVLRLGRW